MDWQTDMIDRLIAAGFAGGRAEAVQRLMNDSLMRRMTQAGKGNIGRCDVCGVVDHHLVDGACPQCHERYALSAEMEDQTP